MNLPIVPLVAILAWIPATLALFRFLRPGRAVCASVLLGYLFLPSQRMSLGTPPELQLAWKGITTGLGLILGVLLFDRGALRRLRFHPLDLAMAAFVAYPLTGLFAGGPAATADVFETVVQHLLGWLVPYLAGKLYLDEPEGTTLLASGVVLATSLHAPVVFWEAMLGPDWFAMSLFYRVPPAIEERFGSWSPQGFMMRRLELAVWTSMAATLAVWLWAGRGWRPRVGPSWWPALVLLASAVVMRTVYGYIALAAGLLVVALTLTLRTRLFLVLLAAALPLYVGLRIGGVAEAGDLIGRAKQALPGRWTTIAVRLAAEQERLDSLRATGLAFGRGHRVWSPRNPESMEYYPDGLWVQLLWEGGLVGLTVYLLAVHLVPAGCALASPAGRPRRDQVGDPAWGLALFSLLQMLDSIHNSSPMYPTALVAGPLVGRYAKGARPWEPPRGGGSRGASGEDPRATSKSSPSSMPASVPTVAALACLLYVFGHGPVEGFEGVKLAGGLGAALLFGAAGGVAAWAAPRFKASKLLAYAILYGGLGVSLNLALHPRTRPVASADLFQGLALAALAVAWGRRAFGNGLGTDLTLALVPLVGHFLIGPFLPAFPGSQYLYGEASGETSLFPIFPWLTLAALGARAANGSTWVNLGLGGAFLGGAAWAVWGAPVASTPVKFPMNPPYALLCGAAVTLAFAAGRALNRWGTVRAAGRWLASRWMTFFYLHFAVAAGLGRLRIVEPWAVWPAMAALGLASTWCVSALASPFAGHFKRPFPWLIPIGLIASATVIPSGRPESVAGLAGLGGLFFAAYWKELVHVVANAGRSLPTPARAGHGPDRDAVGSREDPESAAAEVVKDDRPAAILGRLALLLALLASPEIVGRFQDRPRGATAGGERPAMTGAPGVPPSVRAPSEGPTPVGGRGRSAPDPDSGAGAQRPGTLAPVPEVKAK